MPQPVQGCKVGGIASVPVETEGWTTCVHPSGWKYFYLSSRNIVTTKEPADLTDNELANDLRGDCEKIIDNGTVFVNHEMRYASPKKEDVIRKSESQPGSAGYPGKSILVSCCSGSSFYRS